MPPATQSWPAAVHCARARIELRTGRGIFIVRAATRSTRRCRRHKSRIIAPRKNIRRAGVRQCNMIAGGRRQLDVVHAGCCSGRPSVFLYHTRNERPSTQ